ncbi:MAG: glycoside hydrolase family 3, partial [Deltaproteobacteria bacterium]|nr:glycoside hydrolase family 3 [Deltaproteobacteria bacterium]
LVDMIMTGHLFNRLLDPVFPATLSATTIHDLLRQKLGFDGLVLTDDMQMKAITSRYGFQEALCQSFAAGIDIIVIGNNLEYDPLIFQKAVRAVCQGVRQGMVAESRLYDALQRVRTLKQFFIGKSNG